MENTKCMWHFFQNYFVFSIGERRAVIALVVLILLIIIVPKIYFLVCPKDSFPRKIITSQIKDFQKEYAALEATRGDSNDYGNYNFYNDHSSQQRNVSGALFYFDPNKIGLDDWIRLGLSERQASVIENYKLKGGKFRKPEDIRKIFVLNDEMKERLIPFVQIESSEGSSKYSVKESELEPMLFDFDPNKIGVEEWTKLGLSEKQATVIENYKAKGGKFRKPEDIQKIFVLNDEMKARLLPYVRIGDSTLSDAKAPINYSELAKSIFAHKQSMQFDVIEINTADSAMFEHLRGIGPTLAKRIVAYRVALGGFVSVNQIKEVWGLSDSTFQFIKPHLIIEKTEIRQISLNTASYEILKNHPYIKGWLAKWILSYRKNNTSFKNVEQLKIVSSMTDSIYLKLKPYVKVQ